MSGAAKIILNGEAQDTWEAIHALAKQVDKLEKQRTITEDQADVIRAPLMAADRAYIAHGRLAVMEAGRAMTAAMDLADD